MEERIEALKKLKIVCAMCGKEAPPVFTDWYTLSGRKLGGYQLWSICQDCFRAKIAPHLKFSVKREVSG